jgi:hypothetical protein
MDKLVKIALEYDVWLKLRELKGKIQMQHPAEKVTYSYVIRRLLEKDK